MPRPPSPVLVARVREAWSALRPAVARTGRLEPTVVYSKDGAEHGVPLRPALFRSAAFLRVNRRLCREAEAFAGLKAAAIGRLNPGRWQAIVRHRLWAIRPDWMLLLAPVARPHGVRLAPANPTPAILVVGWQAGASYKLTGV